MDLPISANIKPEYTGNRLPGRSPLELGLYTDQEGSLDFVPRLNREVWRTEVRIGAQVAIDPRRPEEHRMRVHSDTKGLIMRHVYGTIHAELVAVMKDFYTQGIHHGDPAYDRVRNMLDDLETSFRGGN